MTPKKFDGVVEAVRYNPDGQVDIVRMYERRGPTYSDRVLVSRDELIKRLKAGKKLASGSRKPFMASTFEVKTPIRLVGKPDHEVLATTNQTAEHDDLQGVPLF